MIEDYDDEGCLILKDMDDTNKKAEVWKSRPRFSSSSSEEEIKPGSHQTKRAFSYEKESADTGTRIRKV
jgi:hypothetical protein